MSHEAVVGQVMRLRRSFSFEDEARLDCGLSKTRNNMGEQCLTCPTPPNHETRRWVMNNLVFHGPSFEEGV